MITCAQMMDNYTELKKLGEGVSSTVFLVQHMQTKKQFAMKKICVDERKKKRTHQAVIEEAEILAKIKHPHIVMYYESFFDNVEEYFIIIQDFCDAGTLLDKVQEAMQEDKHFEEKTIMNIFVQVTMALQYIHSKKILHRDLKPDNIFLTKSNVVKLGDFGVSKTLEKTLDVAKTVVGAPLYFSPEMCEDQPYTSKTDIWSLGCVLYQMCALVPPFDSPSLIQLLFKIIKGKYDPIPEQYSQCLHCLVAMILVTSPDKRPSASSLLNETFVKDHLSMFIAEKECLLQQKNTSLNRTAPSLGSSSPKLQKGSSCTPSPRPCKADKQSPRNASTGCYKQPDIFSPKISKSYKSRAMLCVDGHPLGTASQRDNTDGSATQACPNDGLATQASPSDGLANQACPSDGVTTQAYPSDGLATQACPSDGLANQACSSDGVATQAYPSDSGVGISIKDESVSDADEADAYSDDFISSSEEEGDISDAKVSRKVTEIQTANSDVHSVDEEDYVDDFEDYDSSDDLDNIVTAAREFQNVSLADDDLVIDNFHVFYEGRNFAKRYIDAIGVEEFGEIKRQLRDPDISEDDIQSYICRRHDGDSVERVYFDSSGLEELK